MTKYTGLLLLAVGGVLGLVVGRFTAPEIPGEVPSPGTSPKARALTSRSHQSGSDLMSDGESARKEAGADAFVMSRSLLAEMSKAFQKRTLKHGLFDREDLIAEHLKITPSEQAQVETMWSAVKEEIKSLEASRCVVEIPGDGPAMITVPDLSAELPAVSQGLREKLEAVLGEERAAIFSGAKQLEDIVETSQGERRYEIKFEPIPNDRWRYHIASEGEAGKRTWVTEDIMPDEIRHLTDFAKIEPRPNQD